MECQRRDCGKNATHAVKLCVPRHGQADDATHLCLLVDVTLCDDHVDEFDAGGMLAANPESLPAMFRVVMSNGPAPDFDRAYAVGVPITDPEYMAMRLAASRKAN